MPTSAAGGSHHRSAAVADRSPHYMVGSAGRAEGLPYHATYTAEGSPHYLRGVRHSEEEARLRARLSDSAAQSASQADVIAGLMDDAQMLRWAFNLLIGLFSSHLLMSFLRSVLTFLIS